MKFLSSLLILGGVQAVFGKTQLYGMNIAGFEFGCAITGDCPLTKIIIPPIASLGGGDGAGQMSHFVKDDKMNIFRLPVSWQYLTNGVIGPLDKKNLANYDLLMQACLKTGAYCMIDIHNFARWNGDIIGQGGPTDLQFADLWTQLATKYANNSFVMFELMNEPHDLVIDTWAASCQAAVNAIRKAELVSHTILLPGLNFSSAGTFISSGWGAAMATVTNPDLSTDNIIFDLHKYLDIDNSGNHIECVMDNVKDTFVPVAAWLRKNKRQAIVSETGAGASDSCFIDFCAQNTAINDNSDVYLGYIAWTAGSVTSTYLLNLAPSKSGSKWTDQKMAVECVIDVWVSALPATVSNTWGLTFAAGTPVTSSTVSKTSTTQSTAAATTDAGSGSGATQTQAGGVTKTIVPASGSTGKSAASSVKVGSGLMGVCSLIFALILL
jgi:endoglucanase